VEVLAGEDGTEKAARGVGDCAEEGEGGKDCESPPPGRTGKYSERRVTVRDAGPDAALGEKAPDDRGRDDADRAEEVQEPPVRC